MKYKKLIKELREIAKEYNLKVRIQKNTYLFSAGFYDVLTQTMVFNKNSFINKNQLVTTFFHELQHHIDNTKTKKFNKLYKILKKKKLSLKDRKYYLKNVYKFENYTDRMGEKLKKKYFPKLFEYEKSYRTIFEKVRIEEFYEYFLGLNND